MRMVVYKTWGLITKDGKTSHAIFDTIELEGQLWAVLEWYKSTTEDWTSPAIKVALNRRHWKELGGPDCSHVYEFPIEWPAEPLGGG
jgi:hypothetical protein